ncbi:ankyrin repeat domain-containing protein 11 [Galendromus occidentalis]|uniref:Ankyrin repeat domain-containing protein 11 n=1 Tax=Galendromus occidentalis TaxID=34638 RepID=A0AAJ6QVI2_9ACAR|nr:ankyrin repeat domain-containing protein 11 [Galendromus occidentalis]
MVFCVRHIDPAKSSPKDPVTPKDTRSERRNIRGETPLHVACINGDYEQVKRLIEQGASVNTSDHAGWTPLHEASNRGWYKVARLLIASGANVNARGQLNQFTPLHDAAVNSHLQIVKLLLRYGADSEALTADGKTALELSTHPKVAEFLSQCHSSVNFEHKTSPPGTPRAPLFGGCRRGLFRADSQDIEPDGRHENVFTDTGAVLDMSEPVTSETPETPVMSANQGAPNVKEKSVSMSEESATNRSPSTANSAEDTQPKATQSSGESLGNEISDTEAQNVASDLLMASNSDAEANAAERENPCGSSDSAGAPGTKDEKTEDSDTAESDQKSFQGKKRRRSVEKDVSPAPGSSINDRQTAPEKSKTEGSKASARSPRPKKQKGARKEEKTQLPAASLEDSSKDDVPDQLKTSSNDKSNSSCSSDVEAQDKDAADGLKVPPLKIVLPQLSGEKEVTSDVPAVPATKGKQLPYIVNSPLAAGSPQPPSPASNSPLETKEQREESKRVTRSSQRAQLHDNDDQSEEVMAPTTGKTHPRKRKMRNTRGTAAAAANQRDSGRASSTVGNEKPCTATNDEETQESLPPPEPTPTRDYFGEPSTMFNPYQALKNIRRAVDKRRIAQIETTITPEAPKHFKKFLLNKCTYALDGSPASRLSVPRFPPPSTLPGELRDLFQQQEEERYRLRLQHVMEKDKIILACEQEILRVNAQAARATAGQTIPLSVTCVLRDLEIYNTLDPESNLYNPRTGMTATNPLLENDKKDLSRYNGRVFTSWLQDVEDKWERNKEAMLLRHHSETEALRAVQKMDWEWNAKQRLEEAPKTLPVDSKTDVREGLCALDINICVPMVEVNDDFELLPS